MFDGDTAKGRLQRARGRAAVAFDADAGGRARLAGLEQSGSAKAMLPRMHGAAPEIVFLNTAGGVTGGDRLDFAVDLAPGARVTATTQTAERAYDAAGGMARIGVRLTAGAGARLDWLPQETILYDGAGLDRRTEVALRGDATCLLAETLVLGRAAMGETVRRLTLRDHRRVTRDGRPVWIDPLHLDTATLATDGSAGLAGARALATIALIGPGAEDAAGALRGTCAPEGVLWAVSGWDGRCLLRASAADGWPLRRAVAHWLKHLRGGTLPRVWQS